RTTRTDDLLRRPPAREGVGGVFFLPGVHQSPFFFLPPPQDWTKAGDCGPQAKCGCLSPQVGKLAKKSKRFGRVSVGPRGKAVINIQIYSLPPVYLGG